MQSGKPVSSKLLQKSGPEVMINRVSVQAVADSAFTLKIKPVCVISWKAAGGIGLWGLGISICWWQSIYSACGSQDRLPEVTSVWMLKDDNGGRTEKNLDCGTRTCKSHGSEMKTTCWWRFSHFSEDKNNQESWSQHRPPPAHSEPTQPELLGKRSDYQNI